jgi:RNA polymerase sigma-70 factor (ECF subfamily)
VTVETGQTSDEDLMRAYAEGNAAAFEELFARYAPILLRVMQRQLRSSEEAHDLVQQTFLQLHRARNDFRADAKLRPWLFTIALNLKREHFRRVKRRPEAELVLDGRNDPETRERGLGRYEAAQAVRYALDKLPDSHREVIELHWLGELSFGEIASLVRASVSAVKVRAHRGYAALRQTLGDDTGNPKPGTTVRGGKP